MDLGCPRNLELVLQLRVVLGGTLPRYRLPDRAHCRGLDFDTVGPSKLRPSSDAHIHSSWSCTRQSGSATTATQALTRTGTFLRRFSYRPKDGIVSASSCLDLMPEHGGGSILDLCDCEWRAVEIDAEGWRVVDRPPAKFCRTRGAQPLPEPEDGVQPRES